MSPRFWRHRITDILEAIGKIHAYVDAMDFEAFQCDDKTIDAVIRNFIVIGEAARHVPEDIADQHPAIPSPFSCESCLKMTVVSSFVTQNA